MEWMIMPLKRYADFSGRSRRQEYWMFVLFQVLVLVAMGVVIGIIGAAGSGGAMDTIGGIIILLFVLIYLGLFVVPMLAVQVRRFHDQDKSGWFILLSFVPAVGGIIMLVFMCLEGTHGPNQYGEDPKGAGAASTFD